MWPLLSFSDTRSHGMLLPTFSCNTTTRSCASSSVVQPCLPGNHTTHILKAQRGTVGAKGWSLLILRCPHATLGGRRFRLVKLEQVHRITRLHCLPWSNLLLGHDGTKSTNPPTSRLLSGHKHAGAVLCSGQATVAPLFRYKCNPVHQSTNLRGAGCVCIPIRL